MKKPRKSAKATTVTTVLEVAPYLVGLLDPTIISNSLGVGVKVLQGIASHYLSKFFIEYQAKIDEKKLTPNKRVTEKPVLLLKELLETINKGEVDDERFNAMKSLFFYSVSKDANEQDEVLAYEFFHTAKRLNSTELLILKANFEIAEEKAFDETKSFLKKTGSSQARSRWRKAVAMQMGYPDMDSMIIKYERSLEDLGLISPRQEDTRFSQDFVPTPRFRLTDSGHKFCMFISKY